MNLKKFAKSRDEAFTKFVMEDDWQAVVKHLRKYGQLGDLPNNQTVAKAGIYKAVQACANIPAEVKTVAARKCIMMGFSPTIR